MVAGSYGAGLLGSMFSSGMGGPAVSSATAVNGDLVFGAYPNAAPIVTTNTGAGVIESEVASGPLASVGLAWWQLLILGGVAWGLLRGKK